MSQHRPARILIADDEPLFLKTTGELLRNAGYECRCVPDAHAALAALAAEPFDLVIADLSMPGNLKLELLEQGRAAYPHVPLIVVTGAPTLPSAIESVRLGIADYLLKPVKFRELQTSVRRALASRDRGGLPVAPQGDAAELIGESPAMREVKELVERVAQSDAHVLITGESGAGKEVVARAIHARSRRANFGFFPIDCTTIPESLAESALFGHAKGAFTGAVQDQPGLLERCHRGTAFLDEIGDLPLVSQAKLLRVVQEGSFTPLGRTEAVAIDARFISATHRDLPAAIAAGQFRRDLYYRIAVVEIKVPPLRARGDDVTLLARSFLERHAASNPRVREIAPDVLDAFRQYAWPGNVRELQNCLEHALSLARGERIELGDLPTSLTEAGPSPIGPAAPLRRTSRLAAISEAERAYVCGLLARHRGNVSRSAREAGITRQGFHKLLQKLGVSPDDFRRAGRS